MGICRDVKKLASRRSFRCKSRVTSPLQPPVARTASLSAPPKIPPPGPTRRPVPHWQMAELAGQRSDAANRPASKFLHPKAERQKHTSDDMRMWADKASRNAHSATTGRARRTLACSVTALIPRSTVAPLLESCRKVLKPLPKGTTFVISL